MCHRSGPTPTKKGTDLPSLLQSHSGFSFQYEDVENRDRGRREKICMRRSVHPEVKDALGEVEIASAPETDEDGGRAALLTGFPSAARNLEPFLASSWSRLHLVLEEQRPVTSEAVIRGERLIWRSSSLNSKGVLCTGKAICWCTADKVDYQDA
ncbi:unnamed protein product [Victoria cruziana]